MGHGRAGRGSAGGLQGRWVPEVACSSRSVQHAAWNIRHKMQCAACDTDCKDGTGGLQG